MRLAPLHIKLSWPLLGFATIALFAVFLVLQAPADRALQPLIKRLHSLHIEGISGQPWSGRAKATAWRLGDKWLPLGALQWSLDASLWPPKISLQLALDTQGQLFSSELSTGDGGIALRDVRALMPAAIAHHWLPPGMAVDGTLFFRAKMLSLGTPPALRDAVFTWRDARLSSAGALLTLGELQIVPQSEEEHGVITGHISNEGGLLEIEGTWRYQEQSPKWKIDAQLRSTQPLPPAARRLLHDALGPTDSKGYHHINFSR